MQHMEQHNVEPRTLADDLLLIAVGPNCQNLLVDATCATHHYLHTIGARVATSKSLLFASEPTTRKFLRTYIFGPTRAPLSTY